MRVIQMGGGIAKRPKEPASWVASLRSSIGCLGGAIDLVAGFDLPTVDRLIRLNASSVSLRLVDTRRLGSMQFYPRFSCTLIKLRNAQHQPTLIYDRRFLNYTKWHVAGGPGAEQLCLAAGTMMAFIGAFRGYTANRSS